MYGCGNSGQSSLGPTAAAPQVQGDSDAEALRGTLQTSSDYATFLHDFPKSYTKEAPGSNCGDWPSNKARAKAEAVERALNQMKGAYVTYLADLSRTDYTFPDGTVTHVVAVRPMTDEDRAEWFARKYAETSGHTYIGILVEEWDTTVLETDRDGGCVDVRVSVTGAAYIYVRD